MFNSFKKGLSVIGIITVGFFIGLYMWIWHPMKCIEEAKRMFKDKTKEN